MSSAKNTLNVKQLDFPSLQIGSEINRSIFKAIPCNLPSYDKVIAFCKNPSITALQLHNLINTDPYLTVVIQNLYNYFYPADFKKFVPFGKIIITLNMNTVKNVILDAAKLTQSLAVKKSTKLWRTSVQAAVCSYLAAKKRGVPAGSGHAYWTAGLINDIPNIKTISAPLEIVWKKLDLGLDLAETLKDEIAAETKKIETFILPEAGI